MEQIWTKTPLWTSEFQSIWSWINTFMIINWEIYPEAAIYLFFN